MFDHHAITIFVDEPTAIIQNVSSGFYPIGTTRACMITLRKEPLPEFPGRSAIQNGSSTERNRGPNMIEPSPSFNIRRLDTPFLLILSCKNWWPLLWPSWKWWSIDQCMPCSICPSWHFTKWIEMGCWVRQCFEHRHRFWHEDATRLYWGSLRILFCCCCCGWKKVEGARVFITGYWRALGNV